jgi:hypothetical protein
MNQTIASPIRQPQRFSIPQRSPVKQLVYPVPRSQENQALTVCIALICVDDNDDQSIVADSDDVDQSFRSDGDQRGAKRREAFSV